MNELITLRDYKDAGMFKHLPFGFDLLDNDGNDITDKCSEYLDAPVVYIGATPLEDSAAGVIAFQLDVESKN